MRVLSSLILLLASAPAWAQDAATGAREAGEHQKSNESFFGPWIILIVVVPIIITAVLARQRAKSSPSKLPVWNDETFESEVLGSRMPVLVHLALDWNITNAAALSQTEVMAYVNRGAVKVGLLETSECPKTMERFPGLVAPAYVLFYEGRKLFHRAGLWQADDLQDLIDSSLAREGF
jgi:hypothetical protein